MWFLLLDLLWDLIFWTFTDFVYKDSRQPLWLRFLAAALLPAGLSAIVILSYMLPLHWAIGCSALVVVLVLSVARTLARRHPELLKSF